MSPNNGNGNGHRKLLHFTQAPQRVVSLVPSLTASLFDLGLGQAVVGVTDYCTLPAEQVARLPHVGGPKNPRVDQIIALQPDLVIADQDENSLADVEALEAQGVAVWVTLPRTVRQAMDVLFKIAELFRDHNATARVQTLEITLDWAEESASSLPPFRYFCPLWQETSSDTPWWITFNSDTYMSDLLRLMGGTNVFADRARRYPLEADLGQAKAEPTAKRDTRFPRVTLDEIIAAKPEVILLPDEPYAYDESHHLQLSELFALTPAVRSNRLLYLDGKLLTWHGTYLAQSLRELPSVVAAL
jgi:ABC-type Fe3+-hydroxamate transport system substrate-binding protein